MTIDITALFVCLDDFCKLYESSIKAKALLPTNTRNRQGLPSLSEIMFIEVLFHFSGYKDFKRFYLYGICMEHRNKFRKLPSYQRFVALKKQILMPMTLLLQTLQAEQTGIYFVDSTPLKACHNKRISRHKVFKGMAGRGKSTMGWFHGIKLHLILNHKGGIVAVKITPGNTDDRTALLGMAKSLKGKCYGDKGYLGKKVFSELMHKGLHLITGIRKNMKQYLLPYIDKMLLRKRFMIESAFNVLKNSIGIEYTRHRSILDAMVYLLAALAACSLRLNKPKVKTHPSTSNDIRVILVRGIVHYNWS